MARPAIRTGSPEASPRSSSTYPTRWLEGRPPLNSEFKGGLPSSHRVGYVDELLGDASGLPVRIAGRAILQVRFAPARAHDAQGQTVAARKAFALPNIMTTVRSGDFEAVTTYGIGLAKQTPFEVFTLDAP